MAIQIDPAMHSMPQRMQDEFRHEVAGTRGGPISAAVLPLNRELIDRQRRIEALTAERDAARASVQKAVKLLVGIHELLYPPPLKTEDGRTLVFRPDDPDPHEVLQKLSDRIRALDEEVRKL